MRTKRLAATGLLAGTLCLALSENTAHAQIPPIAERDSNWDAVSTVSMVVGVSAVSLMPRVYYSSPDATVGWKARWHVSMLAPTMTMVGLTLLVDGPIRSAIKSEKDGCTVDQTTARLPDSGCESWGGPSTHAFAAWGAAGAGIGIFLVDTVKYSDSRLNAGSLVGNALLPFGAAMLTSVSRSADGSGTGPESTGQVVAGALTGVATGFIVGGAYALLQEPDCGYGGSIFCW